MQVIFTASMMKFKDYLSASPPGPCEVLAIIALRNKDKLLERMVQFTKANLQAIEQFSANHKDIVEVCPLLYSLG